MTHILEKKSIVLGVTGSIACYKSAILASELIQKKVRVNVIMTPKATEFITPLTFQSITHRPAITDMYSGIGVQHVELAKATDMIVVAPTTANTIAQIAHGFANDALKCTILASSCPIILAPAMESQMYTNPATQENIALLEKRGYHIAGPTSGHLASGANGLGRMLEPLQLLEYMGMVLGKHGDLCKRHILVTAGGTQEAIDPVSMLHNRSSGKMGHAIASAARDRGASVTLVTASELPIPMGVQAIKVQSAIEMKDAIMGNLDKIDVIIMAAGVMDWRAKSVSEQKLQRTDEENSSIELIRNPDIIGEISRDHLIKVGFADEGEDLVRNARNKMRDKGLDLIIANNHASAQRADTDKVCIIDTDGKVEDLPRMAKYDVAYKILNRIRDIFR